MPVSSGTPSSRRDTRSAYQYDSMLREIKTMIESSKNEVIQSLRDEIKNLKETIKLLTQRVEHLESVNANLNENNDALSNEMTDRIMGECDERRRRENNVVIFGIKERVTGTPTEREQHDREAVTEVTQALELSDSEIETVRRLGKPDTNRGGKRPLLVKLKTLDQKMKLVHRARLLRNTSIFKSVYVNPDLTPLQQIKRKELLLELRKRRANGEDVVISNNKVVIKGTIQNFQ